MRVCRVCLATENKKEQEFVRIFSNNQNIALKIFLISSVKLIENNFPALICELCLKELYQCYLFRKKIQTAEEYFRNTQTDFFNDVENEKSCVKIEALSENNETQEQDEPEEIDAEYLEEVQILSQSQEDVSTLEKSIVLRSKKNK
jgi:Zinc-finger associated domain (zf-AD)